MDRLYFFRVMTLLAALWSIAPAHADWMVQDTSQIGFVSIKNNSIGENNAFQRVSGSISEAGMVAVAIDLTSVETGVGIRNERLQTMLFDVASFPSATVKATLSPAQVMALRGGGTVTESVALDVSLYGTTVSKTAELLVSVLDDDVRVTSTQPIMITAQDFGLESGVAALQKIAGLSAISRSIPITVDLRLKAN
ncbi:MAG: YceI family protein [Luminiphilus sp.]|mgnify:FL=1|nr:YceI family protein [Luminiphilus sp.]MBL6901157.1 YceI family protein [Luminiphilus sp.]